ncbi:hypothetical protein ACFL51_01960 [Myxococcota bacterium]
MRDLFYYINQGYWTKAALKRDGWTEKMIQTFLGEPDVEADNPHTDSDRRSIKLYSGRRVRAVKRTSEFCEARRERIRRARC